MSDDNFHSVYALTDFPNEPEPLSYFDAGQIEPIIAAAEELQFSRGTWTVCLPGFELTVTAPVDGVKLRVKPTGDQPDAEAKRG